MKTILAVLILMLLSMAVGGTLAYKLLPKELIATAPTSTPFAASEYTPTAMPKPTATPTKIPVSFTTPIPGATLTPVATPALTSTPEFTPTAVSVPTETPFATPTPTLITTATPTSTTPVPTATATPTPILITTATPTSTPVPTATATPTPTLTPTPEPTPTATPKTYSYGGVVAIEGELIGLWWNFQVVSLTPFKYKTDLKLTNLSERTIKRIMIGIYLQDGQGKGMGGGITGKENLLPGQSWSGEGGGGSSLSYPESVLPISMKLQITEIIFQ